eukprot:gene8664-10281_t
MSRAIRETIFGGKANYFKADGKDDVKLGKFVVYLKTHFANAGLDVSPFDFDDGLEAREEVGALEVLESLEAQEETGVPEGPGAREEAGVPEGPEA